ncbi:MAG: hypothetical protein JWM74_5631 [Myxococcaceae bacterium]|nr:hypothetical protein [Myxococcaceae bacterium]
MSFGVTGPGGATGSAGGVGSSGTVAVGAAEATAEDDGDVTALLAPVDVEAAGGFCDEPCFEQPVVEIEMETATEARSMVAAA